MVLPVVSDSVHSRLSHFKSTVFFIKSLAYVFKSGIDIEISEMGLVGFGTNECQDHSKREGIIIKGWRLGSRLYILGISFMEMRGQDEEIGMRSNLVPASRERRREHQTLEGHHPLFQHHPHQTHRPTRDPDLTPDPGPSEPAARSATNTATEAPGGSISRSQQTSATASSSIRYRECLRNHAASKGGHVVDGCGEFMPSGEEGTPEALKCAACECHRNFHRKEVDGEPQYITNSYYNDSSHRTALPPQHLAPPLPQLQPSLHHQHPRQPHHGLSITGPAAPIPQIMLAFGRSGGGPGTAAESSSEDLNMFQSNLQGQESTKPSSSSKKKKRFRTKFSQEQKEKMVEFAEKSGWKMQKQDEQEVQKFCSQVGVKRKVFKVWMHNNKQVVKKKEM